MDFYENNIDIGLATGIPSEAKKQILLQNYHSPATPLKI
jgi:hypothetical protein